MDTIVAIATPPGRSAIGIVRLSGPESLAVLRALTRDEQFTPEPKHVVLKQIFVDCAESLPLDSALLSFFRGPHSFTGEDMAEISCHGSPVILRQLLDHLQQLGPRLAGPGEFTLRACQNGKMNLSQAEGIRDLINAQTEAAASQAARQMRGELSQTLRPFKQQLVEIIVRLESAVEFVEDDLPLVQVEEVKKSIVAIVNDIRSLSQTYTSGHLLRDGIKVAIVGRPNVGKSSLFNRLARFDRAIVTDIAGTTRDSITEALNINGVPVVLTDTAGIRIAGDKIEEIGVERSRQAMADADLLVVVVDGSEKVGTEDVEIVSEAAVTKHVVAINKCDLPLCSESNGDFDFSASVVHVSAVTGEGLDRLSAAILAAFSGVDSGSAGLLVTNSRHYDLLRRMESALQESLDDLNRGAGEELVLVGLHNALRFLGEITGETTTEDILSKIFSTFCIGK
jgi:tRNA modification GTPase